MATLKPVLNKQNSKNAGALRVFLDNSWECLGYGLRNSIVADLISFTQTAPSQ
jgi:hypothetical protein